MTASDSGKALLRRQLKSRRDGLDEEYCRRSDAEIRNRLQALPAFRQAGCVFCYVSTGKEPDTRALLAQMLKEGKAVSVPRCREAVLVCLADKMSSAWETVMERRAPQPAVRRL